MRHPGYRRDVIEGPPTADGWRTFTPRPVKPGGEVIRLGDPSPWRRRAGIALRVVVYGGLLVMFAYALAWLTESVPT